MKMRTILDTIIIFEGIYSRRTYQKTWWNRSSTKEVFFGQVTQQKQIQTTYVQNINQDVIREVDQEQKIKTWHRGHRASRKVEGEDVKENS